MNITTSTIRHAFAAAALAALTACGGGGSDGTSQPHAAQQGAIACTGDSIMLTECEALRPIAGRTVRNLADGGGRLAEFAASTGRYLGVVNSDAAVVVIGFGTNEARRWGAADNQSPAEYRATLVLVVRGMQSTGKRVVIETAPPLLTENAAYALEYAEQARAAAADTGAGLCDRSARTIAATFSDIPDGVHPGQAMTELNAQALADCINAAR